MSADNNKGSSVRTGYSAWGLVAAAVLISTGTAAYEIVPASVTPLIRESLQIEPSAAGLIVGVMFGMAVITSLPAGAILDRTNSRYVMTIAVLALFVAGVWGWMAARENSYNSIIASRAIGGIAYVVIWNAGIDIVSRGVSTEYRATAVGMFTASGPIGFALGQGMGPLIADWFGWPAIFLVFNSLALFGLILFWPMSYGLGSSDEDVPTLHELGEVLRNRHVWLIGLLGFLGYLLYLFVNSWGSSYLTEEVGLSLALSGLIVAVFPAVGVVSRISGGFLSDHWFNGERRPVLLGAFVMAAPLLLSFTYLQSVPSLILTLFIGGFAIQLPLGLSFAYIREVVESHVAATAVAFQTSIGLAGAFTAPIAGGVVINRTGFNTAFVIAGGLAVFGVILAWKIPESVN